MMGNWEYDDDPDALMKFDAINDIFSNTVDKVDNKYMTVGVARFGHDKAVIIIWQGMEAIFIKTIDKCGIDQLEIEIRTLASEYKIPFSCIIADEDGVGGGLIDNLRGIKGFVGNSVPLEEANKKVNFKNLRSQCYYKLASYVNHHKIRVNCNDTIRQNITEELEQIKGEAIDSDQKLRVIPKDKIKEVLGRSPDYADTLMMRMWFELKPTPIINLGNRPKQAFI